MCPIGIFRDMVTLPLYRPLMPNDTRPPRISSQGAPRCSLRHAEGGGERDDCTRGQHASTSHRIRFRSRISTASAVLADQGPSGILLPDSLPRPDEDRAKRGCERLTLYCWLTA